MSIIDLEGGSQPISNETGSIQLVFNGEIYNYVELTDELQSLGHRFKTRSDSEVIVHAYEEWGADCLKRFVGIFAFALWDEAGGELFIARDHLGVKPLYYVSLGNRLLFASEVKSLLQDPHVPRDVDLKALGELFTFRFVPSPRTLFMGIRKLSPAHWMKVRKQGFTIERYWHHVPGRIRRGGEGELIESYQELLVDSVRLQMRSDVPVGLFLSSGIDSGVLLAIMSQLSANPVRTFTIGFEGGERTNEIDGARQLAEMFGSQHEEMVIGPEDYKSYFSEHLLHLEEPLGNETAAAFYFVSRLASRSVKVAITGQGADEPWAGYHRYIGVQLSRYYSLFPRFMTDQLLRPALLSLTKSERLRRGAESLSEPDILTRFAKIYSFFSDSMKEQLFRPWVRNEIARGVEQSKEALRRLFDDVKTLDPLTQMLYIDTRASLPDDLLMVGDKTSMANSLELRVPFLDHRLVEFIETLPPGFRLRRFQQKYLHKRSVEKWLPRKITYRRKKGFSNPIDEWLRRELNRYLEGLLLSEESAARTYFDTAFIAQLIRRHREGKVDHLRHLYLLISFELWHRQFIGRSVPLSVTYAS